MGQENVRSDMAVAWLLAARAMLAARGASDTEVGGAAGLYGQAVLGLSERECLEAKAPARIGSMTLVDCLSKVPRLDAATREKIMIGVMMLAFADGDMQALEIRWASTLASACGLSEESFQTCCSSARVMAAMLHPDRVVDGPPRRGAIEGGAL